MRAMVSAANWRGALTRAGTYLREGRLEVSQFGEAALRCLLVHVEVYKQAAMALHAPVSSISDDVPLPSCADSCVVPPTTVKQM